MQLGGFPLATDQSIEVILRIHGWTIPHRTGSYSYSRLCLLGCVVGDPSEYRRRSCRPCVTQPNITNKTRDALNLKADSLEILSTIYYVQSSLVEVYKKSLSRAWVLSNRSVLQPAAGHRRVYKNIFRNEGRLYRSHGGRCHRFGAGVSKDYYGWRFDNGTIFNEYPRVYISNGSDRLFVSERVSE